MHACGMGGAPDCDVLLPLHAVPGWGIYSRCKQCRVVLQKASLSSSSSSSSSEDDSGSDGSDRSDDDAGSRAGPDSKQAAAKKASATRWATISADSTCYIVCKE